MPMVWMVALAVLVASGLVLAVLPLRALRASPRLGIRSDLTTSERRVQRERVYARRALLHGTIGPVLAVAALGGAMILVDELTPWSSVATLLGGATSDTHLLSEELVETLRQAERDAQSAARLAGVASHEPEGLGAFVFDHWPVTPIFALLLALAVGWAFRQAVRTRTTYLAGLRTRRQEYRGQRPRPSGGRPA